MTPNFTNITSARNRTKNHTRSRATINRDPQVATSMQHAQADPLVFEPGHGGAWNNLEVVRAHGESEEDLEFAVREVARMY
jgi:hypothetical protein